MSSKVKSNFDKETAIHANKVLALFDEWASKVTVAHAAVQMKVASLTRQLKPHLSPDELKWLSKTVRMFMDKTDFECELGGAPCNEVYRTPELVDEMRKCAIVCGIVEVEIRLIRVVRESREKLTGKRREK